LPAEPYREPGGECPDGTDAAGPSAAGAPVQDVAEVP
jgi:hypothetical protein